MKLPEKAEHQELAGGWAFQERALKLNEVIKKTNELIDYLQHLDNRIQTLSLNQLEMKQHIQNLRGGWTDIEIKKAAFVWPEIGDIVYCFNSQGQILEQRWNNTKKQNGKKDFMGIFATREAAQAYKEKLLEMGCNSN